MIDISLIRDGIAFSGQSEWRNSWRLLIPIDGGKSIHEDHNGKVDDRNVLWTDRKWEGSFCT